MAKKQTSVTFADTMEGYMRPVSADNEPESRIPYKPGDDFDVDKALEKINFSSSNPYDNDLYTEYGGKYYTGAAQGPSQKTVKGDNQPSLLKAFNGIVGNAASIGTKIGTGAGETAGALFDVLTMPIPGVVKKRKEEYGTSTPHMYENFFTKAMDFLENDMIKENLLPVHKGTDYYSDNILKQLGTMEFWASDFADAIAFSIAAYAPVAAFGKAAKALKLITQTAKGVGLSPAGKLFTTLGATTWNTVQESALEAKEGLDNIREDLASKNYGLSYSELNSEEKKAVNQEAAPYAANIFRGNMAVLAGPNLIQSMFFVGPVKDTAKRLSKAVKAGKIKPEDISAFKRATKLAGIGVLSEGAWEEGSQQSIQDYERSRAMGENMNSRMLGYAYEWLNGFLTTDGQKSRITGAIIGALMGGGRGIVDARNERKFVQEFKNKYDDVIKNDFPKYDNSVIDNIKHFYKTFTHEETDKDGNVVSRTSIFNDEGEVEIDIDKVLKLYHASMNERSRLDNLTMANINMDELHEKYIINESLMQLFHDYMTNPIFEDSNEAFNTMMDREGIKNLSTDEDIKKLGVDFGDISNRLHKMKKIWDDIDKKLTSREDLEGDAQLIEFKKKVAKGILYEKMKIDILTELDDRVEDKEALNTLKEDAQKRLDIFEDKTERSKLYEEYTKERTERIELVRQYKQELTKDPTSIEVKKLEYLIKEEAAINGTGDINDRFSLILRPTEKTGEFGLRNQHYFDIAGDAIVGMRIDAEINKFNEGKSTFADVVSTLLNLPSGSLKTRGKYDITQEDLDQIEPLIAEEKKRINKDRYTKEQYNTDLNNVSIAIQTGKMSPEQGVDARNAIENKYKLSEVRLAEFDDAVNKFHDIDPNKDGKGLLNYRDGISKAISDDYVFMRKVADMPVNEADDVLQLAKNTDKYSDLKKIENIISTLKTHKQIYQNTDLKERLKNKSFNGYIDSIDNALTKLNNILSEVEQNYNEKKGSDKEWQKTYNRKYFSGLGISISDKGEMFIEDKEIYDAIGEIIGVDVFDKILKDAQESKEVGEEYFLNQVFAEVILSKIKDNDKNDSFTKLIEKKYKAKIDEIESLYRKTNTELKRSDKEMLKKYRKNPQKLFKTMLKFLVGYKTPGKTDKYAIDRYYLDNDINALQRNLSEETDIGYTTGNSKETILSFIDMHKDVESYQEVLITVKSDYNIVNQIRTEKEIYLDKKKAPTNQQLSIIRQVVKWAMSPVKKVSETDPKMHRFKTWNFIKGLAGTGKTQFVLDWVIRSLRLKSNEYVTIAPHENAAKMIDSAITSNSKTILLNKFKNEDITDDVKYVFIDEVAALTNPQLSDIADQLQEINEKRKEPLRVIVFGDPSQVSAQEEGTLTSFEPTINRDITLGSEYMSITDPLTIRHRSIIPEINEILDIYENNEAYISGITTYASNFIGYESIGVHAGSRKQLNQMISVHRGNGKSKAIVVFSNNDKASYIAQYPELKDNVYTYSEVAGMEFDEVYVDLSRDQFRDDKEFNKAYYTAISRTKQYAFLYDKPGTFKTQAKEEINKKYAKGEYQKEQASIYEERKKEYEKRNEVESSIIKGTTPKKRKGKEGKDIDVKGKDLDDLFESDDRDDVTGSEELDSDKNREDVGTGSRESLTTHKLKNPSQAAAKFINSEGADGRLIPNGDVIYVKTQDKTGTDPYIMTIHVLGQLYDVEGNPINNRYAHLGIMSIDELATEFGESVLNKSDEAYNKDGEELYNEVIIDSNSKIANLKYSEGDVLAKTVLANGKLILARPLAYKYGKKATYSGEGMINKVIDLFNHKYLKRAKERATYYIEIYNKNNVPEGRFPGVPYLVIEPVSSRNNPKTQQFIALNSRKISKDHRFITALKDFTNDVIKLENHTKSKMGTDHFNNMVSMFSRNYRIENDDVVFHDSILTYPEYNKAVKKGYVAPLSKAEFKQVTDMITPVIKGLYGKGKVKVRVSSKEEMSQRYSLDNNLEDDDMIYEFVPTKRGDGYVKTYSKANKEDSGTYLFEDGLEAGGGYAQRYLNIIAKANHTVNGKSIRVRTLKRKTDRGKLKKTASYVSQAKSMLDTNEYRSGYYNIVRRLIKGEKVFPDKFKYIDDSNIEEAETYVIEKWLKTREDLESLYKIFVTQPITSDTLKDICMFSGDRHSEMRTPLEMHGINGINTLGRDIEGNKEELEELLETNIEDILQTEIEVAVDKATTVKQPSKKQENVEDVIKEKGKKAGEVASKVFRSIKKKLLASDRPTRLGKRVSQKSIRRMINKYIPGIAEEDIVFMEKHLISYLAGHEAWGLYMNGVIYLAKNEDGTVYENAARHEVFHKIYNEYFTEEERIAIDKKAKEKFSDYYWYDSIEECLAVKFHEWRRGILKNVSNYFRKLFQRILRLLNLYEQRGDDIYDLFTRIESGLNDRIYTRGDDIVRPLRDIRKRFGSITNYTDSRSYILTMLKEYREEGIDNIPATRGEILDKTYRDTLERLRALRRYYASDPNPLIKVEADMLAMVLRNMPDLIKDIFPGFNNYADGSYQSSLSEEELEAIEDEEYEYEEEIEESVNLNKHIIENSKTNSEVDLSDDIREFLSYIENENGDYLSWREVYVKLIDMMQGLAFDQDNFIDQMREALKTENLTGNEKAIIEYVENIKRTIDDNLYKGTKLSDTSKFLNENQFAYSKKSVSNIYSVHDERVRSGEVIIIDRKKNESTKDFIVRISERINESVQKLSKKYRQSDARDMLAKLVSHFNSHRQRQPILGEVRAASNMRYYNARGNAVINGIRQNIASQIVDTFPDLNSVSYFNKKIIGNWLREYSKDPISFVKQFFGYIGLSEYASAMRGDNARMIMGDIVEFFSRAETIMKKDSTKLDSPEEVDPNDVNEPEIKNPIGAILYEEGDGFLTRITGEVTLLSNLSRILSSNDAKRNRRYNAVATSQAHKNLFGLINVHFRSRALGVFKKLKIREIFNSEFFKKNIFVSGINRIHSFKDHDGITTIGYNGNAYPVMYETEKRYDYLLRSFSLGFIGSIKQSRKRNPRYIQFIYPNERKTLMGAEIDVLSRDKLIQAIQNIVLQMSQRNTENEKKVKDYNSDSTVGFNVLRKVIGDRKITDIETSEIPDIAEKIYNLLDEESHELTKLLISEKVAIDNKITLMSSLDELIDKKIYSESWSVNNLPKNKGGFAQASETWKQFQSRTGLSYKEAIKAGLEREYKITEEHIQPIVSLFFINNYVNGYELSQVIAGDGASFTSHRNLIHRLPMAIAPGKTGLVNDKYGMKKHSRIAVIEDPINSIEDIEKYLKRLLKEEDVSDILALFDKDGYMPADGQGFMLPEKLDMINHGFGEKFTNILKPQYYNIDQDGVARGLKYSSVALSDDLVKEHPTLAELRRKMRKANVDEIVFTSAMKIGQPSVVNKWDDIVNTEEEIDIHEDSIFIADNRDYRIQLDPAAKLNSKVAHPTQLSYMMRILGSNDKAAQDIYDSLQRIIKSNAESLTAWASENNFETVLKRFTNNKGQEQLYELLASKINFNFPSISDKLLMHFISTIFKRAVRIQYSGTKLILQSSQGIEKSFKDEGFPEEKSKKLKYMKDENGRLYAECIIPRGLLPVDVERAIQKALDNNKSPDDLYVTKKASKDLLGFRMPSSDLHSAVAIKVVGFYDSQKTNVIIAPAELVPLHGSDFDVDSLFIIKRSIVNGYDRRVPVGYQLKDGKYIFSYDTHFIDNIEDNDLRRKVTEAYYTNKILESFLDVITDEKNMKRILSPISFEELKKEKERLLKSLGITEEEDPDISNIVQAQKAHRQVFNSNMAIGMFMNMMKQFAFLHKAQKGEDITRIKDDIVDENNATVKINIRFNGKSFNKMTDIDEDGKSSSYRFDSIGNAALDDWKVNILKYLNISTQTIRAYSVLIMHGVGTKTINNFIAQPILRYLSDNDFNATNNIKKRIDDILVRSDDDIVDSFDDAVMEKFLKYKPEDIETFLNSKDLSKEERDFLLYQSQVYDMYDSLGGKTERGKVKLGGEIARLGKLTNLIRKFPNNVADMEYILNDIKRMMGIPKDGKVTDEPNDNKSDFPYYVSNFFTANPHVFQAIKNMEWVVNNVNSNFIAYSKEFRDIANKIFSNTKIRLDINPEKTKKIIRDNIVKFLMSSLVDKSKIEPYTTVIKGEKRTFTGISAFNRTFVDMVKQAKKDDYARVKESRNDKTKEKYEGNIFLNALTFTSSRLTGEQTIRFGGPATMTTVDINLFRESFEDLNRFEYKKINNKWTIVEREKQTGYSEFQKMFVTYAMINYGMSFGLNNYSVILPGEIYKEESDRLVALMGDIRNMTPEQSARFTDMMEMQLVVNYPESLLGASVTSEPHKTEVYDADQNKYIKINYGKNPVDTYYDRWFESETEREWPKYHIERDGNRYSIFLLTTENSGLSAYYTRVGIKNTFPVYNLESLQQATSYDIEHAYNNKVKHINSNVRSDNTIKSNYLLFEGDKISITSYDDVTKNYPELYTIVKKVSKGIYEVKKEEPLRRKGYFERTNGEVDKIYDNLMKRLRSKVSPFRAGKGSKTYFKRGRENEGRELRHKINREEFAGYNVIKERVAPSGWQVWIDKDEIANWLYGKQLDLFDKGYDNLLEGKYKDFDKLSELLIGVDDNVLERIQQYENTYTGKTVADLLDDIERRTKSMFEKQLIKWIRPILLKLNPVFEGNNSLMHGRLGEFKSSGRFAIDYAKLAMHNKSIAETDRILLHEMVHGLTIIQFKGDSRFKRQLEERIGELAKGNPDIVDRFKLAFVDSEEFISELFSNEKFFDAVNDANIPSKKKGIIREIIDWILSLFNKTSDSNTAYRLADWIRNNIEPMQYEDSENIEITSKAYEDDLINQIIDQGLEWSIPINEKGEEEDHYINDKGHKLKRVADIYNGWISNFRKKGDRKTFGERQADVMWRYTEKDVLKSIDGKDPESYDSYKERMDQLMLESATRGKILHLIDQRYIDRKFNNGRNETLINSKIQKVAYADHYITDSNDNTYKISISINPETMSWYEDNIEEIYKIHDINIFDKISADMKDVIASEVVVALEELGYAGTIDKLIKHSDNTLSIKDINTGTNFDKYISSRLLKYGDRNKMIKDSPRDRKKLQIMTYAFMIKAKEANKDVKFRDLSVMWIPNKWQAKHYDKMRKVEVDDFLGMMKSFLTDKEALKKAGIDENIYETLIKRSPNLFNVSHYTHGYKTKEEGLSSMDEAIIADRLTDDLIQSDDPPAIMAEKKLAELTRIIGKGKVITKLGKTRFEDLSETDKVRARLLTSQILQLMKDPETTLYLNPEMDVSLATSWLGNYYDMNVPQVHVWKKYRDAQQEKARMAHYHLFNKFQDLLDPVLEDYRKEHPALIRNKKYLNNANYKKIYAFAYKEFDNNGSQQKRLITKADKEFDNLTDNQKALLKYMNEVYSSYFGEGSYTDEVATYIPEHGKLKPIKIIDMHNYGLPEAQKVTYYNGWFPKIPKEDVELLYELGEGDYLKGLFSKGYWKKTMHDTLTQYTENQYEGRESKTMVMPLKFMGNFSIDNRRDYSDNLEFQFDRFIRAIEYKKYMDPVYAMGESIRGYLDSKENEGQPMYTNTVSMLEKKITQDVLGRAQRGKLSRKPINFFGLEYEDRQLSADQVFILMRRWVSATTMWLKPFTGSGNGLHANFLKHKDGLKGTISAKFLGIDNDAIDYTLADSTFADKVYFSEHLKNAMLGKLDQDKTWLLLKKLSYLPDNFDYISSEKYLLSIRNKLISESSMYAFHRIPEEFVTMTTMVAQLKHLKHPTLKDKNGKALSIWDCYEVAPEGGDVVWKGGVRGKLKTGSGDKVSYETITELLPREIAKLKRVYERMQGGYRKEEAAAIEVYVLGKVFIQLKKYAPRLILNAIHSKRSEPDLGMLKKTNERQDGEEVFEWLSRLSEGRWRVLGKFLLSTMLVKAGNPEYKWSNMPAEYRQHIIDACITLGAWAASYAAYLNMFGDDKDDDTLKKMWKMYLLDNLSQQFNPIELLKLTKQMLQPVALTKAIDTISSIGYMTVAGINYLIGDEEAAFTNAGDLRGLNNFKKSVPIISSYEDMIRRVENISDLDVQFGKYR